MRRLSYCMLTLLLMGLCQYAVAASPQGKYAGRLSSENVRIVPSGKKVQSRVSTQSDDGISETFMCNRFGENSYTNYGGIYLNNSNEYAYFWNKPDNILYEENQTVLNYTSSGSYFYFRSYDDAPVLEAVKVYLDPEKTNNASVRAVYADFDSGSLYYSDTQITADYDNNVLYWKPDSKYDRDNIFFYIETGELNVIGFSIYSEGKTPSDFLSGSVEPAVSSPVFRPSGCEFSNPLTIEILAEEGNEIYYRTDGLAPYVEERYRYTGPFVISSTTTVKAIAVDAEGNSSRITTAKYVCTRHGIGEGYDPSSPGDPEGTGSGSKAYHLTVVANPSKAGAPYASRPDIREGESTWISTSAEHGYVFKNWTIEGTVVSTEDSFQYVMPGYDVTVVANYEYNPVGPGDPSPEDQKVKHPVVLRAIPSGAASLSPSGPFDMEENDTRWIYAYPLDGWKFMGWTVNGERQPEVPSPLQITMGEKALDIAAYFEYSPSSPVNPGANSYNAMTGRAIVDDFTPGGLYDTLSALVGTDGFSGIVSLVVKGVMTRNDLGVMGYLGNANTIDLSRTGGIGSIPSYAFSSMNASEIILPETVASMSDDVFSGCPNLSSLIVYAQEPPACGSYTFSDFPNKANCMVYVPVSAMELYSNADYWKDFTIQPIIIDAHVLQVNLPENAADGRYKHNTLELVNVNSGVRQKYVISDRLLYTFNGLRKDEQYNVYMFSQAGLELGCIENVVIPDNDIEVTFDNLKTLHTVFAQVVDLEGTDVTPQVTVEWLKPLADGTVTYLRKATSLGEVPEGQQLICRITLDNKLGSACVAPEDVAFTVDGQNNTCTVNLAAFRSLELTGEVVDGDGAALSGASVSVNQTLNGKYFKTYTAKTDRNGRWTVEVLDAPETRLTYSASECVNVNDTIGAFAADVTQLDLGRTMMRSIVGARVTYSFTYHAAGAEDEQSYYSDYQNVVVSVFNVTQNRAHKDVSMQYPIIAVLDENINTGDELQLTATSKTGAFNPIVKTVTVGDNQRAEVTFDIVGKGGISASFEMTDNPAVVAMLYSNKGELLQKKNYSEAKALFTELEDGEYTLVSMGDSELMSSILRLSSFGEIGLTEGKDYVKNALTVESGRLTEVMIPEVPIFDESLFYYTTPSTGFSANKSSVTTGNYLTLRAAIDFKGIYKKDIRNVSLVLDLPEGCDFVEQSVIQGPNLLPYTFDNERLTIQLGNNYQNQTRFCIIPTKAGKLNSTASIVFDYKGKTFTQPLGVAASEIKSFEIIVPKVIAGETFTVSGMATPNSKVDIFENGSLLGSGKANAAGSWNVKCVLPNPQNLSKHSIYAEMTTQTGNIITSETKEMRYDMYAVQVSKVVMYHWNPEINNWKGRMETSEFDFLHPKDFPTQWIVYYPKKQFTYTIEFTENDPERIADVVLYIHTADGKFVPVNALFDESKGFWYAEIDMGSSCDGYYPVNCSVNYDYNSEILLDADERSEAVGFISSFADGVLESGEEISNLLTGIFDRIDQESDDSLDDQIDNVLSALDIDYSNIPSEDVFESEASFNKFCTESEELFSSEFFNNISIQDEINFDEICAELEFIDIKQIDENINESDLVERGYEKCPQTDGNSVYVLRTEDTFTYIDINSKIQYTVTLPSETSLLSKAPGKDVIIQLQNTCKYIESKFQWLDAQWAKCLANVSKFFDFLDLADPALKATNALAKSQFGKNMKAIKELLAKGRSNWSVLDTHRYYILKEQALKSGKLMGKAKKASQTFRNVWTGALSKGLGILTILDDLRKGVSELNQMCSIYLQLPDECPDDSGKWTMTVADCASCSFNLINYWRNKVSLDVVLMTDLTASALALVPSLGASMAPLAAGVAGLAVNYGLDYLHQKEIAWTFSRLNSEISSLRCEKTDDEEEDEDKNQKDDKGEDKKNGGNNQSGSPSDHVQIDPSGFVYEAVPENRVEGVQASIYYKETKEDMYGDPYEEIVLWNAEEYAQQNPLFTDENGMYRWDVPQGLWQVKFEKDGYVTAYSDWLPVPPPQLEVNIGIVQNKQPEVTEARAYEEGVEVQFDKFMDLSTLTTDNIFVTANGEKLNGEIRMVDPALADEYANEDDADALRYASRVRFVPEQPLGVTTGEIRLTVSRNVLSYAGIPMTETFSQVLDVEKEVQSIYADDVKVLYGGEKEVTVYALPYEAAVGRTLHIANSSDLIASTDITEAVLDAEGKAVVKVRGDLPGRTQLTFSIDDVTVTGDCAVDVVREIITAEAPKSSRASGTAVYRGSKIELTTESKNGTIYFTTDGSCPCDENGTRRKYTVPIIINDDTRILAMTSVGTGEGDVSETVEFNYTLKHSDMDFQMAEGWTWISHNLESEVPATDLTSDESIQRIMSQTEEVVRDPRLGMVGTLSGLVAPESYKVESNAATARKRMSDVAWNPATPIALNSGWNWLGYPAGQTMTLDEAFAPTKAETLDVVVGQNGFAQYDGEKWVGTLETMSPGMGYMYQSQTAKNVVYNTSIVSNAAARYAAGITANSRLAVDIHKYPSVMPVIATLGGSDGTPLDNEDYQVAAFCGTECRGIGRTVDGLVMMNVYGNPDDRITFGVTDAEGEENYSTDASLKFSEDVVGDLFNPYVISINVGSGVAGVRYDGDVRVRVDRDMLLVRGIRAEEIDLLEVYGINGQKLIRETNVPESGVRVSSLEKGVYVVVVYGNGEYTYHRVAVK